MSTPREAVAYVRASTDRQEKSCADQLAAIAKRAERDGFRVAREFVDDGVSGTSLDRPGLGQLRDFVAHQRTPGRVYVWHRDRLGRVDGRELGSLDLELERAGWPVYPLEGAQRTGDAFLDGFQTFAEGHQAGQFSRELAGKTLRGQRQRALAGTLSQGGPVPYGYARRVIWPGGNEPVDLPRCHAVGSLAHAESSELVPGDPDEVAVVVELFGRYAEGGESFQSLADDLNARGVPSPAEGMTPGRRRSSAWSASTVADLVSNPVFAGDQAWNRRTQAKFRRLTGEELAQRGEAERGVRRKNAKRDWVIQRDAHPALVDRATWERCQAVRTSRGSASGGGRRISPYALSKLVTCEDCGRSFTGTSPNGGRASDRYAHHNKDARCPSRSVIAADLERGVLVVLQGVFRSAPVSEWRRRLLAAAKRLVPRRGSGEPTEARRVRELEAWLEQAVSNLGLVSGAAAAALADQIEAKQRQLEELRGKAGEASSVPLTLDPHDVADEALELVQEVATLGLDLPPATRRRIYQLVLEAVVPHFERIEREGKRARNLFKGATLRLTSEARGVLLLNKASWRS